jgi:hypothetical protein
LDSSEFLPVANSFLNSPVPVIKKALSHSALQPAKSEGVVLAGEEGRRYFKWKPADFFMLGMKQDL